MLSLFIKAVMTTSQATETGEPIWLPVSSQQQSLGWVLGMTRSTAGWG